MSWYDAIPGLIFGEGPRDVYNKAKGAVDEQKQGMLTAAQESAALGDKLYGQSQQGLARAEAYYQPAQQMNRAAFGDPGALTGGPAQYPVAPGRPR